MKLASHYNRNSIHTSFLLLIVGSVIYFFTINLIAKQQLDQTLEMQLREAYEFLNTGNKDPQQYDMDKDHAIFYHLTSEQYVIKRFFDTVYINPSTKITEPGRAVEDLLSGKNYRYKVIVTISRTGNLELVKMISVVTLALLMVLIFLLFMTSKYVFTDLWKSFYGILGEIKHLSLDDSRNFTKQETNVDEFRELNDVIYEMSVKNKKDYLTLKNFTENASHEMMTPLAVITTKLDQLIQGTNLTTEQLELIGDIYSSVNRSSRLNQSLILLTKIENNLHPENEFLNINEILLTKINQVKDLLAERDLTITQEINYVQIYANKHLIDLMLNNFLTNAIWHNINGGKIHIQLSNGKLIVANTGLQVALLEDTIFNRFQKSRSSQGMGLGLTLIKNICEHYLYKLTYHYEGKFHVFTVKFI